MNFDSTDLLFEQLENQIKEKNHIQKFIRKQLKLLKNQVENKWDAHVVQISGFSVEKFELFKTELRRTIQALGDTVIDMKATADNWKRSEDAALAFNIKALNNTVTQADIDEVNRIQQECIDFSRQQREKIEEARKHNSAKPIVPLTVLEAALASQNNFLTVVYAQPLAQIKKTRFMIGLGSLLYYLFKITIFFLTIKVMAGVTDKIDIFHWTNNIKEIVVDLIALFIVDRAFDKVKDWVFWQLMDDFKNRWANSIQLIKAVDKTFNNILAAS